MDLHHSAAVIARDYALSEALGAALLADMDTAPAAPSVPTQRTWIVQRLQTNLLTGEQQVITIKEAA